MGHYQLWGINIHLPILTSYNYYIENFESTSRVGFSLAMGWSMMIYSLGRDGLIAQRAPKDRFRSLSSSTRLLTNLIIWDDCNHKIIMIIQQRVFLQCNMIGCLPRFHLLAEINWSLHHVGSISDFRFLMISVCSRCALYLAVSRKITRFSGCQGHLKRIASSSWRWSCSPPSTSPRTHMIHQGLEGLPSTAKV